MKTIDAYHWTRRAALPVAVAGALLVAAQVALACTIDGKATAFANGSRAIKTRGQLTLATAGAYAPFSFPGRYADGTTIRFAEDQTTLSQVLVPDALHRAWLWQFGDGKHLSGWRVTHRYAHPGTYRIMVEAYYPSMRQYYPFDTIRIVVTR